MIHDILSQKKEQMRKAIEHLTGELVSVRTGRANASLLEGLRVNYYGASTAIKEMATIQIPDATSILIQPWDPKALNDIEEAIRESDMGLQPTNDGRAIRLVIPPLTTERRTELVKMIHKMGEETRVSLRSMRKDAMEEVNKGFKDGSVTEDEKYTAESMLNKTIDEFNAEVEKNIKQKESDLLVV